MKLIKRPSLNESLFVCSLLFDFLGPTYAGKLGFFISENTQKLGLEKWPRQQLMTKSWDLLWPLILFRVNVGEAVLKAANRFGSLGTIVPACLVNPGFYENLIVSTECSDATKFFTVGPSGYVRVCNHSSADLAHIDRIQDLKLSEYWKTFSLKSYLPEGCGGCLDKISCDGGCPVVGDDSARYASSKCRH